MASRCQYCRGEIIFARTKAGKALPIDLHPLPREAVPPAYRWQIEVRGHVRRDPTGTRPTVLVSHFTVCPVRLKPETLARLLSGRCLPSGRSATEGRHGTENARA